VDDINAISHGLTGETLDKVINLTFTCVSWDHFWSPNVPNTITGKLNLASKNEQGKPSIDCPIAEIALNL
jgi:hypothetical protein